MELVFHYLLFHIEEKGQLSVQCLGYGYDDRCSISGKGSSFSRVKRPGREVDR